MIVWGFWKKIVFKLWIPWRPHIKSKKKNRQNHPWGSGGVGTFIGRSFLKNGIVDHESLETANHENKNRWKYRSPDKKKIENTDLEIKKFLKYRSRDQNRK